MKREKKLFETAEWLKKNCVLAYQNGNPGRKIMVRPLSLIMQVYKCYATYTV